jgi:hypothetical protein
MPMLAGMANWAISPGIGLVIKPLFSSMEIEPFVCVVATSVHSLALVSTNTPHLLRDTQ